MFQDIGFILETKSESSQIQKKKREREKNIQQDQSELTQYRFHFQR